MASFISSGTYNHQVHLVGHPYPCQQSNESRVSNDIGPYAVAQYIEGDELTHNLERKDMAMIPAWYDCKVRFLR